MPESGFLMNAQKDAPGGIPTLDDKGLLQLEQLPEFPPELIGAEVLGASERAIASHEAEPNPHPQYEDTGTAARTVAAHESSPNPHPNYEAKGATLVAIASHLAEINPHNRNAIATPYSPNNPLITANNLQTAIDQLTAIVATQQAQIQLLTPKTLPPLVNDTFTSADNTLLDARSPDTSPSAAKWVRRAGGWKIVGGMAQSDGTAGSLAYIEGGAADKVTVEADVLLVESNVQQGLIIRLNPTSGYHWRCVYTKTKFEIIEVGSSTVSRVNFPEAIAFNQSYKFKVLLDGSNIIFYVNNVQKVSWTSFNNQAETKMGLYSNTSPSTKFDNFKVVPV